MKLLLTQVLFVLLLIGCSNDKTNIKQTQGDKLRIVSLASSISEELTELGVKDNIIGATSYCKITHKNKELIVGTAIETNEEKILLLKPDIVFVTSLTKQTTIDILKKNGVSVFKYTKANSFEAISKNFIELGKRVKKEKLAFEIVLKAKSKIDSLSKLIPNQENKQSMLFQLGSNPIATVIPDTYMDEFIKLSGAINLFFDLDKYIVSRESVLIRNPDVIFITTMGVSGNEVKNNWLKFEDISAVKNNKIFLIDANKASLPTVTNFVNTLEIMINKMYF